MTGRVVTLVLVERGGLVLGALPPFAVETPWWQDVRPIVERLPGVTVLRLLGAGPYEGGRMGGAVTYLAELAGAPPDGLRPFAGELGDHPLRMPWARPGGPAADLAWAAGMVEPAGPPVQERTWNLSAIWSIPTAAGTAWLKCLPPFFAHEAAVLRLLAGEAVPRLLGADRHRVLLAAMAGRDGYDATAAEHLAAVEVLVSLQLSTAGRADELLAAGVPDWRTPALLERIAAVVDRRAPADPRLRRLLDEAPRRMAAVEACRLPDVLVHGDAHPGNTRLGADRPIWFDWGDCCLGNPLLDLAALPDHPVVPRWLDRWAASVPGSDPHRAWELLAPLAALRPAVVFQGFLDAIEPSERPYHEDDVLPALERAAGLT